jgi:acyl-CoA synthetase (AMP-forming)/AMP-acid ligase II/acyl carrier protein
MSPQSFIRRPIQWLRTVQDYGAVVTGAPNFAFELCADRIPPEQAKGLDLSSLQVMFCGAEPIRAAALRAFESRFATAGFNAESFYPCYGLAESTLLACGGRGPGKPRVLVADRQSLQQGTVRVVAANASGNTASLVACGQATGNAEVAIVDPVSHTPMAPRQIGEIWLRGLSIATGYWNAKEGQQERFNVPLATKRSGLSAFFGGAVKPTTLPGDASGFFRTGDLGFLHNGELYITGRIKELIIVRGRNYFPQDIEATVLKVAPQACGRAVAISVDGPRGESLGIAVEVSRRFASEKFSNLVRRVRRQIISEHDVDPREVILVSIGALPVTTSGKLRRSDSRRLFSPDTASVLYHWCRSNALESPPIDLPVLPPSPTEHDFHTIQKRVCDWMVQWLIVRGGIEADQLDISRRFEDYGLDSLMAIELVGDLEDACDIELTPTVAMEHPTILKMATLVAHAHCGEARHVIRSQELITSASQPDF